MNGILLLKAQRFPGVKIAGSTPKFNGTSAILPPTVIKIYPGVETVILLKNKSSTSQQTNQRTSGINHF